MPANNVKDCPDDFPTPDGTHRGEILIKRSRFIATIGEAGSRDDAMAFIASVRQDFPDASHHCWAYISGAPTDVHGVDKSDDGEPRGTAGKPILNVLQHSGLGRVVVVITRYFGGTKLGAGGLIRAYGQATNHVLTGLPTKQFEFREFVEMSIPYSRLDEFEHWLSSTPVRIQERTFAGKISLLLSVPGSDYDKYVASVSGFGEGQFEILSSTRKGLPN